MFILPEGRNVLQGVYFLLAGLGSRAFISLPLIFVTIVAYLRGGD